MKYKAILFDLDGTLLPMNNDEFLKGYFKLLYGAVASKLGYEKDAFVSAMWKGVGAMVKNDTDKFNCERFWEIFPSLVGDENAAEREPVFDAFYTADFEKAIAFTAPTELAKKAVALARSKAEKVVLATNPFFPPIAVKTRMKWAGLTFDDFDHVTHYANSKRCKPNPEYYIEVAGAIGVAPKDCLMIGNNAQEDIEAAQSAGMDTFLITDCLISNGFIPETPKGNFEQLIEFISNI